VNCPIVDCGLRYRRRGHQQAERYRDSFQQHDFYLGLPLTRAIGRH
jgi:hypothetical protein